MENWKDIPNFKGYQVSNMGRIRTHNKTTHTEKHGIRHWKDRILKYKGKCYATGYRVSLWKDGKPKDFLVARLVAFTFYGKDINNHNLTVNHINGNRLDNRLENLELVTLKENIQHGFRIGLYRTPKKVYITDKKTKKIIKPISLSKGSLLIGKNVGYLSSCIKKGIYENDDYYWVVNL